LTLSIKKRRFCQATRRYKLDFINAGVDRKSNYEVLGFAAVYLPDSRR